MNICKSIKMTIAAVLCVAASGASAAVTGSSNEFRLDCRTGERTSPGTETLSFSSLWDGGDGASVVLAQDGTAIFDGLTGAGVKIWTVDRNGRYTLTHTTYRNGAAVKVETAVFVVEGLAPANDHTLDTPVPVPYEWLDRYGLGGTEAAYETAAMATAANGVNKVWQCYVAGLDPTDKDAVFRALISIVDDAPVVSWEPKLPPDEEAKRSYTVKGKAELTDDWAPADMSTHRFFKVDVEMK